MFAAAPAWFADNVPQIATGTLLLLIFMVLRFVQQMAMRLVLLAAVAVVGLLIYVNRAPLRTCARDCECELGGRTLTVPFCDADLRL
ncbi:MAG: hypothetical protein WD691_01980 [Acidimicrobiales bacterium]